MPEPKRITSDSDFYLGGIRFDAGTYEIRMVKDRFPWLCDHCHTPVPTNDAPCPVHGAAPPGGWCPF